MELLRLDGPPDETLVAPVLIVSLEGWTDAGRVGSRAGGTLREQWQASRLGVFHPDALFDYCNRRPRLSIDRGRLGQPVWPAVEIHQLVSPTGTTALLVDGDEPDFRWQTLCADLTELARLVNAERYLGLGAVPAPVPHTRPTRVITTSSDETLLDRYGRHPEALTVPASFQAVVEATLRDAGLVTLGLWARVPHYLAGEYPAGTQALLRHVSSELNVEVDLSDLCRQVEDHRRRLDEATAASREAQAHIRQLEDAYDRDVARQTGFGPLPTGDEIAAELERFLREQNG